NSAIGGGQTLGKRVMRVRVVDRSGQPISPGRSFLRYTVLGAPYFVNHLLIPPSVMMSPIGLLIGFILFGCGGAILFFFHLQSGYATEPPRPGRWHVRPPNDSSRSSCRLDLASSSDRGRRVVHGRDWLLLCGDGRREPAGRISRPAEGLEKYPGDRQGPHG